MCFSAGASFSASAFLAITGLIALHRAPRGYRMIAAIPLLFAIQQFCEGWLWLILQGEQALPKSGLMSIPFALFSKASKTLSYYMDVKKIVTNTFLLFAYVVWPVWIPAALWRIEREETLRHTLLFCCLIIGAVVSGLLLFGLLMTKSAGSIVGNHISYTFPAMFVPYQTEGLVGYAVATITPFFLSSLPGTSLMGITVLGSLLLTLHVWACHVTSIWCFFAAFLSVLILWFLPHKTKSH